MSILGLFRGFILLILFLVGCGGLLGGISVMDKAQTLFTGAASLIHLGIWLVLLWQKYDERSTSSSFVFVCYLIAACAHLSQLRTTPVAVAFGISTVLFYWIGLHRVAAVVRWIVRNVRRNSFLVVEKEPAHIVRPGRKPQKQEQRHEAERPAHWRWRAVLVEGNICAGKTTLAKQLAHGSNKIKAYVERLPIALHEAFEHDPAQYGFTLQMTMAERRKALLTELVGKKSGQLAVIDRSLIGDYAFAAWNYVCGNIAPDQFEIYKREYGTTPGDMLLQLTQDAATPHLVLFVCTPALVCAERLAKRAGVDQGASPAYLLGLSIMHMLALAQVSRDTCAAEIHINYGGMARELATPSRVEKFLDVYHEHPHVGVSEELVLDLDDLVKPKEASVVLEHDAMLERFKSILSDLFGGARQAGRVFGQIAARASSSDRYSVCEKKTFKFLLQTLNKRAGSKNESL